MYDRTYQEANRDVIGEIRAEFHWVDCSFGAVVGFVIGVLAMVLTLSR